MRSMVSFHNRPKIAAFYHFVVALGIAALVLATTSCETTEGSRVAEVTRVPESLPQSPDWLWDTRPNSGELVFVAAGSLRGNRNEEAFAALEDAALQAGVFSGFWGANQDAVVSSSQGTSLDTRTRAYYDGPAADSAAQELEADEIWRTEEGTWVRFRLVRGDLPELEWKPVFRNDNPTWIRKPPEIDGWRVAVGVGAELSTTIKSMRSADESALAEMVNQIHGANLSITASREVSTATWSSSSGAAASYDRGFGEIRGFLIIARWIDPSGNCWSMAVCPAEWNR